MTSALKLVVDVLTLKVPPRGLWWGVLNKANFLLKTGNRRYEFERLYLERGDPWNYHSSPYEREKYDRTLACALKWRRGNQAALEVGCSVGIFSKVLAPHFTNCVALDVSSEVLRAAADYNRANRSLKFVRGDLRSLDLGMPFDVIICAEVLYYILPKDVAKARRNLDKHLAPHGILILVSGIPTGPADAMHFNDWDSVLATYLHVVYEETVQDPMRPYRIVVFSRRH